MNYCRSCFEKVHQVDSQGNCIECSEFSSDITKQTKKPKYKDKFKKPTDTEEWINVPSPYKDYRDKK